MQEVPVGEGDPRVALLSDSWATAPRNPVSISVSAVITLLPRFALFSIHISCMTLTCSSVYLFLLPLQRGCWRGGEEEVCVHVTVHGQCGGPSGPLGRRGGGCDQTWV